MDDTGLLRDLARAAREEEAEERDRWDRWDRLTDGELSPEEEAELQELAGNSAESHQAYEAFRPLSPEFRAKMVAEIGPLIPPSVFVRWRDAFIRWRDAHLFFWRAAYSGSGLAAAATTLILVLRPLAPIPVYTLAEVIPGVKTERGEGAALFAGEPFTVDAHAEKKFGNGKAVEPYCFVKIVQPVAVHAAGCSALKRYENGSMTVQGRLPQDLPAGRATLWVVIAYPGHQPTAEAIEASPGALLQKRLSVTASKEIEIRTP